MSIVGPEVLPTAAVTVTIAVVIVSALRTLDVDIAIAVWTAVIIARRIRIVRIAGHLTIAALRVALIIGNLAIGSARREPAILVVAIDGAIALRLIAGCNRWRAPFRRTVNRYAR